MSRTEQRRTWVLTKVLAGELTMAEATELLGLYEGVFWSQMQAKVDFYDDLLNGIIKSLVFGFVVVWIAVFEGHDCVPTSEGLGQATTRTVVHGSLAVLGLDFVLTALMFTV